MMPMKEQKRRKEHIESLTPTERGVFADMIMRSLRGSWRSSKRRASMLLMLGKTGEMEFYDADKVKSSAESYLTNIDQERPDGRYWRRMYEDADVDVTVLNESTIRELSTHIPDDKTWDDWRINKEFNDNE